MPDERPWRNAAAAAAVASRIAVWPVLGALAGRWIDDRWQTGTWPTVVLTVTGLSFGVYDAWRAAKGSLSDDRPPR